MRKFMILAAALVILALGCGRDRDAMPTSPPHADAAALFATANYDTIVSVDALTATPYSDCDSVLVSVSVSLSESRNVLAGFMLLQNSEGGSCGGASTGFSDYSATYDGPLAWSFEFEVPASAFGGLESGDTIYTWGFQMILRTDDPSSPYISSECATLEEPWCSTGGGGGSGGGSGKGDPPPNEG